MCFVHSCGLLAAVPAMAGDEISLCSSTKQERQQAWRRVQVPAGGLPSRSWYIQVVFSSTNMFSGQEGQQTQQGNNFLSVLLQSKPNLTFNHPYTVLTYSCSPTSSASPPTLTLRPRGPRHATGVHQHTPQLRQQPGLAQAPLESRAAPRMGGPSQGH